MIELLPTAIATTSGKGTALDLDTGALPGAAPLRYLVLYVNVTALTSMVLPESDGLEQAALYVGIESSDSLAGPWRPVSLDPIAALGLTVLETISYGQYVRASYTLATDATATLQVSATTAQVLADLADLEAHGLPDSAARNNTFTSKAKALLAASGTALSKLSLRYDLPLTAVGSDVREAVSKIAGYNLLSFRGGSFNSEGSDGNIRTRFMDAMKWLDDVVDSRANPVGLIDSTVGVDDDGISVVTDAPRWSRWSR